jgi:hypothetical protein
MNNWAMVNNWSNIVMYLLTAPPVPTVSGCYAVNVDSQPQVQVGWSYDPATGAFSAPTQ